MNNNYIKVRVEGRNVNNYIKWLIKQRINIINLNVIRYNQLEVIINYKDYKQLKKYSKTYKVTTIKKYGVLKLLEMMKNNSFILVSIIFAIIFLYFLSNVIFSVDIVYNNKEVVENMNKELKKYVKKDELVKDLLENNFDKVINNELIEK